MRTVLDHVRHSIEMARAKMSDDDAIERLIAHHGTVAKTASAMGIGATRVANWRHRGISNEGRPVVCTALRLLDIELPPEWAWSI